MKKGKKKMHKAVQIVVKIALTKVPREVLCNGMNLSRIIMLKYRYLERVRRAA